MIVSRKIDSFARNRRISATPARGSSTNLFLTSRHSASRPSASVAFKEPLRCRRRQWFQNVTTKEIFPAPRKPPPNGRTLEAYHVELQCQPGEEDLGSDALIGEKPGSLLLINLSRLLASCWLPTLKMSPKAVRDISLDIIISLSSLPPLPRAAPPA